MLNVIDVQKILNFGVKKLKTTKSSLEKGIFPCGCAKNIQYNEYQNYIRVKRKCDIFNYEFLGWTKPYTTIGKTGFKVFDRITKTFYNFHSIANFFFSQGLTRARVNQGISSRQYHTSIDDIELLINGNYIDGTKVINNDKNRNGYWLIYCPICSNDEYVQNGLCSGEFSITKGDLDKGVTPCRCSNQYRWNQEQREYQINKVLDINDGSFVKWVDRIYKNRSSKFIWNCCRGHEDVKSVLTFLQGSGCTTCYTEDKCYGYYPTRSEEKDKLYLINLISDYENFYKIGRSFDIASRFSEYRKLYNVSLVGEFNDKHERVYMLEQCYHRLLKDHHYKPLNVFGGSYYECFTPEIINVSEVIELLNLKDHTND